MGSKAIAGGQVGFGTGQNRLPPNPQMQSDRPIGAKLGVGGTIAGCEAEALICVGAGCIGHAADLPIR